jgi:hypothetical protein
MDGLKKDLEEFKISDKLDPKISYSVNRDRAIYDMLKDLEQNIVSNKKDIGIAKRY